MDPSGSDVMPNGLVFGTTERLGKAGSGRVSLHRFLVRTVFFLVSRLASDVCLLTIYISISLTALCAYDHLSCLMSVARCSDLRSPSECSSSTPVVTC